jgi:hypothetical protein
MISVRLTDSVGRFGRRSSPRSPGHCVDIPAAVRLFSAISPGFRKAVNRCNRLFGDNPPSKSPPLGVGRAGSAVEHRCAR